MDDDEDYGYDEEDDGDIISDSEDKELVLSLIHICERSIAYGR